ncbi:hypothetical protein FC98_GL001006 [Lentilactobacillus kisonensis DSM 19906 = JCM 15041]|uniref:Uncharacterized protein n=1 Tax=Lentilactobacillus kisonensis DSM 19906 = JCM 15041 TaxID=1423766 RepID=A0A0R1NL09_9LACO|nr:hypothetical protein FC98_GL001006 [Lentilactobacillus kisonensis DSM 19906 = JCM 15041]
MEKRCASFTYFRTAAPGRNFHISTSAKNPQNQGFLSEETYVPVSNRLAPLTYF